MPVQQEMTRNMAPRADTAATAHTDVPPDPSWRMLPPPDPFSESAGSGRTGLVYPPSTPAAPMRSRPSRAGTSDPWSARRKASPSPGIAKASAVAASSSSLVGAPGPAGDVATPPTYDERTYIPAEPGPSSWSETTVRRTWRGPGGKAPAYDDRRWDSAAPWMAPSTALSRILLPIRSRSLPCDPASVHSPPAVSLVPLSSRALTGGRWMVRSSRNAAMGSVTVPASLPSAPPTRRRDASAGAASLVRAARLGIYFSRTKLRMLVCSVGVRKEVRRGLSLSLRGLLP
mmetsp:Transcript_32291/g.73775  ORF Transcript_32291/g.73775 Transcript_32291/m.73775 type:complete len:287 (-) Transcript_32291:79-939(-)